MPEADYLGLDRPTVSAIVFSLNEGPLLRECLPRLADFDEVVVCDMASDDETPTVAAQFASRRVDVPRVPLVEQVRQRALDAATTDWVLFVDADELVPADFRSRLDRAIVAQPAAVAWRIRYENFAFGYPQPHTWAGSAKYSLVRRDRVRYREFHEVHHPPVFDGPVADAPDFVPAVIHLNYRDMDQSIEKVLRYAAHSRPTDDRLVTSPWGLIKELIRVIVFAGAWRDGRAGVFVATSQAFGRYYAQARVWEEAGYPEPGWGTRQFAVLSAVGPVQRFLVRVRNLVRSRRS